MGSDRGILRAVGEGVFFSPQEPLQKKDFTETNRKPPKKGGVFPRGGGQKGGPWRTFTVALHRRGRGRALPFLEEGKKKFQILADQNSRFLVKCREGRGNPLKKKRLPPLANNKTFSKGKGNHTGTNKSIKSTLNTSPFKKFGLKKEGLGEKCG